LIITNFDDSIEIGPGVTASIPLIINGDYHSFRIFDIDRQTQDLALSCWFSKIVPFENPVPFENTDLRKHVQQLKSLVIYGKSPLIILPEGSPNGHTVNLENGLHYLNIQNMAGQYKKFTVNVDFLNN
jgi:hypothetical protein